MNKTTYTHNTSRLSLDMKIVELIDCNSSLLSIFDRLDIKLPFGDMSLNEMCQRDGYPAELFIEFCNMHIDLSHRPNLDMLTTEMIPHVVSYLRASHNYYLNYMLPHVASHLDEILTHCDNLSRATLRRFYDDYAKCLTEHLAEVETTVFANIDSHTTPSTNLDTLDTPHDDINDRTNDIASLIIKYLPEQAPTKARCAMLYDIYALRDDLRRHSNLETYILKPLIAKLKTGSHQ